MTMHNYVCLIFQVIACTPKDYPRFPGSSQGTKGFGRNLSRRIADIPKLLDQIREAIRRLRDSIRTEDAHVNWTRRFIIFHGKRHPLEMGELEVLPS